MIVSYLLQTTIIWLLAYVFYRWWLSGEKMPRANRFFLLIALVGGPLLPLLPRPELIESVTTITPALEATQEFFIQLQTVIISSGDAPQWWAQLNWAQWLWLLGSLLFFGRMLYGWWHIYRLYRRGQVTQEDGITTVRLKNISSPFSYGSLLFWDKTADRQREEWRSVWQHERAHVVQGHSYDLLAADLILLFFWWNPLPHLYRKALRLQHEYLADAAAVREDPKAYARLLLQQHLCGWVPAPSHAFHNSHIKNRIIMLTQPRGASWKLLAILPLLIIMFWACEKEGDLTGSNIAEAEEKMAQDRKQDIDEATGQFEMVEDTIIVIDPETYEDGTPTIVQTKLYTLVDQMPIFGNCEAEMQAGNDKEVSNCSNLNLLTQVYENVEYPESARKAGLEGLVVISFRVPAEGGQANSPIVVKSAQPKGALPTEAEAAGYADMDQAVLDMFSKLPAEWKGGVQDGKNVTVKFNLPVKFKLQ